MLLQSVPFRHTTCRNSLAPLILLPEGIVVDPSFFEETDSALLCRSPGRSPKGTPKGRSLIFLTPVNTDISQMCTAPL
jgi:hypothetical protein